ncbi:peptide ABC transporter substrate-binding protein [Bacillus sp. DTU_2020_1000418_1_SI_GHA_SEK_038]|uniref:peptide ABC transporter substrate-binding protein n=1 Tax=Bacillus sp. DTU_2020_1000418_1_SI_GHA_SEK_038 TaxID=3077585 RepID=UPI0028ED4A73|nr:peptide ABC transporter substrate-binding protein [Bacillus sp. DTU_2020_1000418_1_SI_GHA_SEK_038]WNS74732.1 peptide ABC transporter substrate-binding protein [Bacillus sp. DTU_2020_1000418_1_SI_GHA_SEK_038]
MIKQKPAIIVLFSLLIVLALTGCYGKSNETSKQSSTPETKGTENNQPSTSDVEDQTLNLYAANEIPTLKTNGVIDGISGTMMLNLYEGLYREDQDQKLVPGIAKDHEVSNDGKTYTFHLRDDAKWSNGTQVTAHDFVFAWQRALHPDTLSPHSYEMDSIVNAVEIQDKDNQLYGKVETLGVKAIDDFTLEVQLKHAIPYFLDTLNNTLFYPQNEEFLNSQGDNYALEPEYLIYNGPFILDSWKHEEGWVLKKNPTYWDAGNVKIETINFKVVKDVSTGVNLYDSGSVDMTNLSSEFIDLYQGNPDLQSLIKREMYFIRFNLQNKYLSNVNIRKAIDMGWNKKEAAELILKNGSIPAYYLIPEKMVTVTDGSDFRSKHGNFNDEGIEKAQEYWQKGLDELGTDKVELEFLSYDDGQRKSVAEYIKNQLEKNLPGLTLKINQQPNKQKLALEGKQEYDMSHSGWRSGIADPTDFMSIHLSDGPYNWQSYVSADYDKLVKKAQVDFTNIEERFNNLQDAEQILIEKDVVISPMYQASEAYLLKPYVKGFVTLPNTTYSYKWTYIEGK